MPAATLLQLMWLASPALPVGGFSDSEGLEPAIDAGYVTDEASAGRWLTDPLHLSLQRGDLPLLASAFKAWQPGSLSGMGSGPRRGESLRNIPSRTKKLPALRATFSPELSDLTIYVIDVAAGEKIPRKGGAGITKSDLFVINKIDLAPYVGTSLEVMVADTQRMRGPRPFVLGNLRTRQGLAEVVGSIERQGLLVTDPA